MGSCVLARLPICLLVLTLLVANGAAATAPDASWLAVLAAGDDAEPVFDDATHAFARRLAAAGVPAANIHRLTASRAELRPGIEPATAEILLQRIAGLSARPGDLCFVFLTSHGEPDAGLWLALSHRALHPAELAHALSRGCPVPTVVIVSGCYTGGFAAGSMAAPNRIILTAARRDRPSFGCQVERTYTFFDQCLLGALPGAANWQAVFAATSRCVGRKEHTLGERPSEPQAYFGLAVANMRAAF